MRFVAWPVVAMAAVELEAAAAAAADVVALQ
jgi:hypothetical protein